MKKIYMKKEYIMFLIYNLILLISFLVSNKYELIHKIQRYVLFETEMFSFKELLSISITILTIAFGAILTISTVLISMCDKRLMKLLNNFNRSSYVIKCIKKSIKLGITVILLYSIVYAQLDYRVLSLRILILYSASFLLILFLYYSKILVTIIISLLNDSLENDDSIKDTAIFKKPEK